MNRQDYTNLGGYPFSEQRQDFLQQNFLAGFAAIAKLCGNKSILTGIVVTGSNVSDGWFAYNGELIKFNGGSVGAKVVITEVGQPLTFLDGSTKITEFTKTATCGVVGDFDFADLVPLLSLQNIWKAGDLRHTVKDADYEAANFDANGVGINLEIGWKKLSAVYAPAAGAVLVNKADGDAQFGLVGLYGGEKTHTLTGTEQGPINASTKVDDIGGGGATVIARLKLNNSEILMDGGSNQSNYGSNLVIPASDAQNAHNNLQPYFVVLTLIKL